MPKKIPVKKVREFSLLLGVCLASGLVACSGDAPSSSTQHASTENIDSDTDAGLIEQPDSSLISTTTLQDSGLSGAIPLLEARASITVSEEFDYIENYALSPDGSGFAIALSENGLFNPRPNPKGDRIEIYNTNTGQLVQTLGYPASLGNNGHLFWSTSNRIHLFFGSYSSGSEPTERWVGWDATTGVAVQDQSVVQAEPCDNWSGMFYEAFHSSSDTVVFIKKTIKTHNRIYAV